MAQTTPRPPATRRSRPAPATSPRRRTPRRPRSRPPSRTGRVVGIIVLGLLAGLALYGGYAFRSSTALQKYASALFRHGLHQPSVAEAFPGQPALNVLLIGRDADYSNSDQVLRSNGRSDMLMMAHLDFPGHRVHLLSIPRDTRARIDGHGVAKINAAHKWGGPALTARTVQENFGIPTDRYVSLDFAGFEKAIDLLGGVDLVVDKKMDYDDNWGHLHIHLRPGLQHLNGQQAMGFVRFRHSDSDLVRVGRQQTLLAALKAKLREPQTLAKLPALLDLLDAHLASDLSTDQRIALARFAHDTPRAQIQMATLPSRERGASVTTDWAKAGPIITQIFNVTPPDALEASAVHGRRHHRHRLLRLADTR